MAILIRAGITKISELDIDADKDWNGKGIHNLKELAKGMSVGDICVFDGIKLVKLPPAAIGTVLTSQGPGLIPIWAPGGTYLDRYLPCVFEEYISAMKFTPPAGKAVNLPITSPYGLEAARHPEWYRRQAPNLRISKAAGLFTPEVNRDNSNSPGLYRFVEIPVEGAVADDGGVKTDETPAAKSAYAQHENYSAGEDNAKSLSSSSTWEAQTFTPAVTHYIRYAMLKLYRSSLPGIITLAVRAVDGLGHPAGADLCQGFLDGNMNYFPGTPGMWQKIVFADPVQLTAGTQYALVLRVAGGGLSWRVDATSPVYSGGRREYSTNSGTNWTSDAGADFIFEEWGTAQPDLSFFPAAIQAGDAYYFGHRKPFFTLIADIGISGAGTYSLIWEYSLGEGAYAACAGLIDGSNKLQSRWLQEITHTPQADWAAEVINGKSLYWLRCRCTDPGAGYSQPKGNFVRVQIAI